MLMLFSKTAKELRIPIICTNMKMKKTLIPETKEYEIKSSPLMIYVMEGEVEELKLKNLEIL